ncbi:hypothetical protein [Citrobacter koseri]|uniref:hypothetical protein n=1 Tax=Citrobacter koseri TaxID=545 RepID=UPI00388FFCCE|nr:hypothetical protein [Citrobacter koseri]
MNTNYCILGKSYHIENVENIYDEISTLDFNKSVSEEISRLDEDLFQLVLNDGSVVDIGWYPSFGEDGKFIIQVILNGDWDHPAVKIASGWDKNELIEKLSNVLGQ